MPNWQPEWEDVVFNHAAADAAVTECNLAAGALDNATAGLAGAAATLATDGMWYGMHQVNYDVAEQRLQQAMPVTAADLRRLAANITGAATRARTEQAHRESERARWMSEKAAEDAAAGRPTRSPRNRGD
jgi:hypothetical protein